MQELTDKQKSFVENYVLTLNATDAAKKAGYSEKTAYSIGSENLTKPEIKKAIKEHLDALQDEQRKRFIKGSSRAIDALLDVLENGGSLARVQAANSLLDRAGHKPVDQIRADVTNHDAISEITEDKQQQAIMDAAEALGSVVAFKRNSGKK
jgi:phage terminase small subunit